MTRYTIKTTDGVVFDYDCPENVMDPVAQLMSMRLVILYLPDCKKYLPVQNIVFIVEKDAE